MDDTQQRFWTTPIDELFQQLESSPQGLSTAEAAAHLQQFGLNQLSRRRRFSAATLLLSQFKSPITLLLIAAAILSFILHDATNAVIILLIVLTSALLGFWQEKGAAHAMEKLLALVSTKVTVIRDGSEMEVPPDEVARGDLVLLSAGSLVPADGRIVEARDLFVNEAALTGETFPAEKQTGRLPGDTPLNRRANCVFSGTNVVSGTASVLIIKTGAQTEFGAISKRLAIQQPETAFERGVRRFGYFLMEVTMLLILTIFAINVMLHRPVLESFLFSLALAVGLTPQLLPAIISVNLAHGARRMADRGVIVRRLSSIENFGSINVLCSDKTGTLTEGVVQLQGGLDARGNDSARVLELACVNASFESGFVNPIDQAIRCQSHVDLSPYSKLDEIPYDFSRKRLGILVRQAEGHLLITKGAFKEVLACCRYAQLTDGSVIPLSDCTDTVQRKYQELCAQGMRVLGVATREVQGASVVSKQDETEMVLAGLLVFADPAKPDVHQTVKQLHETGVSLKVITGDNRHVAAHVAAEVGLNPQQMLTGGELRELSNEALIQRALTTEIFAEVEPNQKERIVLALKNSGQVVGYLGDGINDVTALHAADVGISVDQAVDVAKEAADLVLLKHDLAVLLHGIQEGRVTFANTLKYVFMATSANFGNMFSMAGASLFLPFLPLLPKQILFLNLMTDLPEMTIATDSVDRELVGQPRRWNVRFIRNFMLLFGPLSSIFDFLTFGVLLLIFRADMNAFRTGWFIESVVSAPLVVLVIRTRRSLFGSRPSLPLALASVGVIAAGIAIPYTPLGAVLGLYPMPLNYYPAILAIVAGYIISAELVKQWFYRRWLQRVE